MGTKTNTCLTGGDCGFVMYAPFEKMLCLKVTSGSFDTERNGKTENIQFANAEFFQQHPDSTTGSCKLKMPFSMADQFVQGQVYDLAVQARPIRGKEGVFDLYITDILG